jgi:enoyl-CoA hydratase/carnithine racemase
MPVHIADHGAVRVVKLSRPEALKAFDGPLYRATGEAVAAARDDDGVHALVLTGEGRAFSAGQDLKELAKLADPAQRDGVDPAFPVLLSAVQAFDKPLLAAVNGLGVGIGFTLLVHCDLVLVADDARLRVPFAELGVPPEAGSSLLFPLRMGWQRAAYVLFTSDWITAQQAVEYGIAFESVPADEVLERTIDLATRIAAAPLPALRAIKSTMLAAFAPAVVAARQREDEAFAAALGVPRQP